VVRTDPCRRPIAILCRNFLCTTDAGHGMQRNSEGSSPIICQAIQQLRKLIFHYNGLRRVVAPYCYGISTRDTEVLRGVQIGGASNSRGYGFGKLWTVSE